MSVQSATDEAAFSHRAYGGLSVRKRKTSQPPGCFNCPSWLRVLPLLHLSMKTLRFHQCQRPTVGLKTTLLGAMLLTITATGMIVYLPWAWLSKRHIDKMVHQTNQEISVGTSQEVERLLQNAESAQQMLSSSLSLELLDLQNPEEREFFMLSVLASTPAFTWVQFGDANGDFVGAQRTANDELHFHLRDWDAASQTTQATVNSYQVSDGQFVPLEHKTYEMNPAYCASDRPWYTLAIASPSQTAWTVYVYRSSGQPGLDASTVLAPRGEVLGVIGVGIELQQLSEYLEVLQGDRPGETFIVNSNQELIASTDKDEVMPDQSAETADPALTHFEDVQNPLLRHVNEILVEHDIALAALDSRQRFVHRDPQTGESYHIFFSPLGELDWVVGTVIPESIYTADIKRNKRFLLVGVLGFTAGIAIVALVMADRLVARPILGIAHAAADIEANRFNPNQLSRVSDRRDEIGRLARTFQTMAIEVHLREQRLRSQVRELRVEIDEAKCSQQVKDIVDTDFFKDLAIKAKALRDRRL